MSRQRIALLDMPIPAAPSAVLESRAVDFNGAQITVAGAPVFGISKQPAAAGEPYELAVLGTAVCETGAAFAKGAAVMSDASGRVIAAPAATVATAAGATAVTSSAANGAINTVAGATLPQYVIGYALEASTGVGQFVEVLLSR